VLAFGIALAVGAALRLPQLAGKPGWQYDEGVYTLVARNLLQHGTLNEHITFHAPWSPFLYQPLWYFLVLSRWFAVVGPSIYHARLLGVACSVGTLTLLFALLRRSHGARVALAALIPVIFDGWLLYIQRISYLENVLLLLVTAGMLCYQRALARPSWQRFALAGAALGFAACFKYTGAYVIPAVLLCWLIVRRDHKGHLILLGTALLMLAADQALMVRLFDVGQSQWYVQQNLIQLRRVVGARQSGGTLANPLQALHLLAAQYAVFLPSLLIAVASFLICLRRLWSCFRERSWARLRGNALLFSWLAAGVIVFGASSLRLPQYFALILVPMYCYLWTEVWQWDRATWMKAAAAAAAAVAGLASFWLRVPSQTDNAFAQVQAYAAQRIPAHSVVVTEEVIGDLISQPYCRTEVAAGCLGHAAYAITWKTYLQSSFQLGDAAFHKLMRGAVQVRQFSGFSGTATVWRLK
jgi:4-amino-4-deoxy-L-arabinose transferase-like glycosyltransferase